MKKPLVSIVIPVYNRRNTVEKAIGSVLDQTYPNIELLVIDDGSADGTFDILERLSSRRIRIIRQAHKGANAARNLGIRESKGEFIAFQDSDDEWLPDKLERQISYMAENGYEACYCPLSFCESGECREYFPQDYRNKEKYERNLSDILRVHSVIGTPTLVIHKNVIRDVGLFDEEMPRLQDYEYVIRIVQKKKIGYVDEALVKVHRAGESISGDERKLREAEKLLLKKHGDFFDIETSLRNYMGKYAGTLQEAEMMKKLDSAYMLLEEYLGKENSNVYKMAAKYLCHAYKSAKEFHFREYELRTEKLEPGQFAIYGAGYIGKRVFQELRQRGLWPKYFLVSDNRDCLKELYGVPVVCLDELTVKDMAIIVAVSQNLQWEIVRHLVRNGYVNYFCCPY